MNCCDKNTLRLKSAKQYEFAADFRKNQCIPPGGAEPRSYQRCSVFCCFLRYCETEYVTPHTVMDASSSRSISWENSHVFFVRSSSGIPMPEELMEP